MVRWNGDNLTTSFLSSSQLTVSVPTSHVAGSGTAIVAVFNPGIGLSNALSFPYNTSAWNPTPSISVVSLSPAPTPGQGLTLAIQGAGFIPEGVVRWSGQEVTTHFVSGTRLLATVSHGQVQRARQGQVSVFNPAPGGGLSNIVTVTSRRGRPTDLQRNGAGESRDKAGRGSRARSDN